MHKRKMLCSKFICTIKGIIADIIDTIHMGNATSSKKRIIENLTNRLIRGSRTKKANKSKQIATIITL
jgi:hypothetical protein